MTADFDIFTAAGTGLRILTYTDAPGTEDATKFHLIRTVGTAGPYDR